MKREIKNNGEYVEVDVSDIITRKEELENADIVVIKSARVELAGLEKKTFMVLMEKFMSLLMGTNPYFANDMTEKQQSDFIFRSMLITLFTFVTKKKILTFFIY